MISVVIPAFDEHGAIGHTVSEVRSLTTDGRLAAVDIVVVDDGSGDGTGSVAAQHGARVVRHPHNLGYGRALKTGIQAADHDTIVIIDADGTYPIGEIPRLLQTFGDGFDMVVAARPSRLTEPGLKRALRVLLTFLVQFTVGRKVPDVNSGLRVFSRRTVLPYFSQLCDTFSFTTSLTLAYMMTGRFVGYVPIAYEQRVGTTKVRLVRDALRTLQYIVQAIVYYNPIKIFLLLALACLVVAGTGVVIVAALGMPGALVLGIAGILLSIVIFSLGLLADLLRQIMGQRQ
jgi:glycosyltransferase involved in cell wall biosynthesis